LKDKGDTIGNNQFSKQQNGWNEPTTTSAPVQDEVVQAILWMNQKHIIFPCLGIFQPLLCPKIFPSYLPPPSYCPHFISC